MLLILVILDIAGLLQGASSHLPTLHEPTFASYYKLILE